MDPRRSRPARPAQPHLRPAPASTGRNAERIPATRLAFGVAAELATIQRKLRRDVHEPLAQARAEVARTSDWCRILDQTKDRLDVRLRGD
jgi:hypothetical protein